MVTAAGGDARGTDPRVVNLQSALSATKGVVSLTPPQLNKKGDVVLLSAVPSTSPASDATADLVREVRSDVLPPVDVNGMTSYVGGYTASYVDLAQLITARLLLVIGTVILLGFLLLMVAFRSLLIPLQAAVTNLLSAAASFGVLTAVFQWGWGISQVGIDTPDSSVPIASYVPLMMFAVLFGLSMDYEVFLVSHVQMHHHQGEEARQAVGVRPRLERPDHVRRGADHGLGLRQLHPQRRPGDQAVRRRAGHGGPARRHPRGDPGAGPDRAVRRGRLVAAGAGSTRSCRTSRSRARPCLRPTRPRQVTATTPATRETRTRRSPRHPRRRE